MAHPLDSMFRNLAQQLLGKAETLTVKHVSKTGFSVALGSYASITSTSAVVSGYVDARDLTKFGDTSPKGYRTGDRKVYIPAKSLTFEPLENDLVTYNGADWSVVQVQATNGYQDPVLWELFIRKGAKP